MDIIIDLQNSMVALWNDLFEDTDTIDPIDEIYVSEFLLTLGLTIVMFILYAWYMIPINYIRDNIKLRNIRDYDFKIKRKV
ncbi:MAG: hypothetical protein KAJ19_23850 [Gammaproteobacteria bacterium]|nr:hypothetical protein [Gammaproteobacteria bacterium]